MGVPQNRWFARENPIKIPDLGVPLFQETTISKNVIVKPPADASGMPLAEVS